MTGSFRGVFALMNRSLRTEDRLIRTHLYRFVFVLLSYAMLVASQGGGFWFGAPGLQMFRSMSYLNFFCITVAGLSFFAVAITEEKEDMTLGLLKMAGVSPIALLLGKSIPGLIAAMVLLTAQLPFTMLAITLGGISLSQVLAVYFCLLAYLILVANVALCFSVTSSRSRTAGVLTGAAMFIYFFGPALFGGLRYALINYGWWRASTNIDGFLTSSVSKIASTSAFTRVGTILQTGFNEPAIGYQVISNVVAGVAFLLLGWMVFERCTRNETPASEARGLLFKRIGARSALGPARAWSAALCWKDFHFVGGGKIMLLLKTLIYASMIGLMVWMQTSTGMPFRLEILGQMAMSLGVTAIVIELGVQASRIFYTEMKWKTLSSIVLLPKTIGQIAYAKIAGAAISFIPAASLFLVGALCAPEYFGEAIEEMVDEPGAWYMFSQIVLFAHLAALLSLYLRWGAFPLTMALIYGGNMVMIFVISMTFRGSPDGFFILPTLASFAGCIFIQYQLGVRLKQVAAA